MLLATAPAQDPAPKADPVAKLAVLRKALQKMEGLQSCSFTCREQTTWTSANANAVLIPQAAGQLRPAVAVPLPAQPVQPAQPAQPGQPVQPGQPGGAVWRAVAAAPNPAAPAAGAVAATWADGLLVVTSNDGRDQFVARGRRTIARQGEGAWQLRHGLTSDGQPLPKAIDPETFFTALAHAKLELLHDEVGSLEDRPVEILTAHAAGEDAYDLLLSGLLPDAATIARAGTPQAVRGGLQLEVDIAVWLDPATARVHQIKVRCYTNGARNTPFVAGFVAGANGLPAARVVQVERQAEPEEDAAKPKTEAKPEPMTFKNGLPVRNPKSGEQLSIVSCDVVFTNHDAAKAPELDARARELLGLPAK